MTNNIIKVQNVERQKVSVRNTTTQPIKVTNDSTEPIKLINNKSTTPVSEYGYITEKEIDKLTRCFDD